MNHTEGAARRVMRVLPGTFCLLLVATSSCTRSSRSGQTIHLDATNPSRPFIEVSDLSRADLTSLSNAHLTADEWTALLRVSVRSPTSTPGSELPPMAGRYTVEASLRFWPAFPLDPGREYEVRFDPSKVSRIGLSRVSAATATVSIPADTRTPSTVVDAIYPSGDVVPENQLRMYLHFSAPMGQQGGLDHITFVDDGGREVPHVMVPLDTELWNAERTRYTVILDPGRVKREILPNRQLGRALHAGDGIAIVVKQDWPDAHGIRLATEFRHRYRVGPSDEKALSTAQWHVTAPAAGSRDPLTVIFPKPKPLVQDTPLELFIYGPVPLMTLAYSALRLFQPDADLLLNLVLHYAFGLLVLMCLGFAVAAVANSHWIAGDSERPATRTMLIGALLGAIPVAVGLLTESFLPYTALPLSDYYALSVILVTLSFGKALWQLKSTGEVGGLRRVA